jgi:hypothetical protein
MHKHRRQWLSPEEYFRRSRSEPRVRLPDLYGSDEFTATYRACLAGQSIVVRNQRQAPETKFKGLIDLSQELGVAGLQVDDA